MIFISHDLAVVKGIADHILVMQSGEIVEQGDAHKVFENPQHLYTQKLINAIPSGAKTTPASTKEPLLTVENLCIDFPTKNGVFRAVDIFTVSPTHANDLSRPLCFIKPAYEYL